jgi:nitronate monooxygenase
MSNQHKSRFDLASLPVPVIQAPMAGGPSTPRLAAAVSEAGGLGFLAAGYKTADAMRAEIGTARGLTGRPFGVNLFVPQAPFSTPDALRAYADALAPDAGRFGVRLGDPRHDDDDWDNKVDVLLERRGPG